MRFEGTRYIFLSLDDARTAYYSYTQPEHQTLAEYLTHFKSLVDVLDHYKASVGEDPAFLDTAGVLLEEEEPDGSDPNLTAQWKARRVLAARYRTLAIAFLKRSYKPKYGALVTDLENQYTRGTDQYPNDLTSAYNMLLNYRQ